MRRAARFDHKRVRKLRRSSAGIHLRKLAPKWRLNTNRQLRPKGLRVLTFNVWNEEGDPRRIESINRELQRLDPDLVAFQEVVQTSERDQLAKLLEGTKLHGTHQA